MTPTDCTYPAFRGIINSNQNRLQKKRPADDGPFRSHQTTPHGGVILSDIIQQDIKVVKPPDLIFLQFDEDDMPETFCVDSVDDSDVLYLRFDLIKEILRRLHRYGDAALFDDKELQSLWDILSTLNRDERAEVGDGV